MRATVTRCHYATLRHYAATPCAGAYAFCLMRTPFFYAAPFNIRRMLFATAQPAALRRRRQAARAAHIDDDTYASAIDAAYADNFCTYAMSSQPLIQRRHTWLPPLKAHTPDAAAAPRRLLCCRRRPCRIFAFAFTPMPPLFRRLTIFLRAIFADTSPAAATPPAADITPSAMPLISFTLRQLCRSALMIRHTLMISCLLSPHARFR